MESDKKTGSRNRNGDVPNVNWNRVYGKLYVNAYNASNRNDNLRPRAEISKKGLLKRGSFLFKIFYPAASHLRDRLQILLKIEINLFRDDSEFVPGSYKPFQSFYFYAQSAENRFFVVFCLERR